MEVFLLGLMIGLAIGVIVMIWHHSVYLSVLKIKAKDKSSECIDGKFYTILPESEYIELMTQARKYSAMADREAHWAGFYDKRPGPEVS